MKSPSEIGSSLARQWHQSSIRTARLLNSESWPLSLPIGKPSGRLFTQDPQVIQRHVQTWRDVRIGSIEWESIGYRSSLEPIAVPVQWVLRSPSEWIAAASDAEVGREYASLEHLVEHVDKTFHRTLIAQRALWLKKPLEEVITTADLATRLTPRCAQGRPLRLLSEYGVDTKFFERNSSLLTKLLDERFEGEVSQQGLTVFLDAFDESSHWVLIAPLASGLLPFKRLRVTTAELSEAGLPCLRILAVENERCVHLLPELPDTIAVLGSGLDLGWLASPAFAEKSIGYWGDMDTWGLLMLARARVHQPRIAPLLMNQIVFDQYADGCAVIEPVKAGDSAPEGLIESEASFYRCLLLRERGRLEQEYLPLSEVETALINWSNSS